MSDTSQEFYNGLIANVGGNRKFLEFMDAMVLPYEQHYAMLQGSVGRKYAVNSGIRTVISEYDANNKTIGSGNCLLPTYLFSQISHICLKNTEENLIFGQSAGIADYQGKLVKSTKTLLTEAKTGIAETIRENDGAILPRIGKAVKLAQYSLSGLKSDGKTPDGLPVTKIRIETSTDFTYHQDRTHPNTLRSDGTCRCDSVDIQRRTFIGDDESRLPWLIRITMFDAKYVRTSSGGSSYAPDTLKNREEHTFRLTDQDMYRCAYSIEHFVAQWERANLVSFIRGMDETAKRKQEYNESRAVDGRYSI